jgi:biotin operon repressor
MDLESRGYEIKIDTMKFYELVKKNSQPSTIEWLKKHPPNEDDWLAPLNFNYR